MWPFNRKRYRVTVLPPSASKVLAHAQRLDEALRSLSLTSDATIRMGLVRSIGRRRALCEQLGVAFPREMERIGPAVAQFLRDAAAGEAGSESKDVVIYTETPKKPSFEQDYLAGDSWPMGAKSVMPSAM